MKMNPPANSSSPTSRKKPRIMRHPPSVTPPKTLSAITGATGEIQPHQYLMGALRSGRPRPAALESVDGAKPSLYKGVDGGGRNPPPLFFGRRRACWHEPGEHIASRNGIPQRRYRKAN